VAGNGSSPPSQEEGVILDPVFSPITDRWLWPCISIGPSLLEGAGGGFFLAQDTDRWLAVPYLGQWRKSAFKGTHALMATRHTKPAVVDGSPDKAGRVGCCGLSVAGFVNTPNDFSPNSFFSHGCLIIPPQKKGEAFAWYGDEYVHSDKLSAIHEKAGSIVRTCERDDSPFEPKELQAAFDTLQRTAQKWRDGKVAKRSTLTVLPIKGETIPRVVIEHRWPVPGNGSCALLCIIAAHLIPALDSQKLFKARVIQLAYLDGQPEPKDTSLSLLANELEGYRRSKKAQGLDTPLISNLADASRSKTIHTLKVMSEEPTHAESADASQKEIKKLEDGGYLTTCALRALSRMTDRRIRVIRCEGSSVGQSEGNYALTTTLIHHEVPGAWFSVLADGKANAAAADVQALQSKTFDLSLADEDICVFHGHRNSTEISPKANHYDLLIHREFHATELQPGRNWWRSKTRHSPAGCGRGGGRGRGGKNTKSRRRSQAEVEGFTNLFCKRNKQDEVEDTAMGTADVGTEGANVTPL
jgi:hypothetical protein